MNLVGKIFVFLVFVMSLVFASLSVMVYSTHTNWRDEVLREEAVGSKQVGWVKQLENAENSNKELTAMLADREAKLAQELAEKRQAIAKLEATNVNLQAQQSKSQSDYQKLLAIHAEKLAKLESTAKEIVQAQKVIADLRQAIKRQQETIDQVAADMIVRTEANNQLAGEVERLTETNQELTGLVARAKELIAVISENRHTIQDDPTQLGPGVVEGVILAVSQKDKDTFVALSLGSDDGLKIGHELQVYRGSRYLGNVVVTRTDPDRSAARVDRSRRLGPIQVRDRFESRDSVKQRI